MKYQSKKDETVFADLVETEEKYGTVMLVYTSGEKNGKSFSVTTSTLKRWWKKVEDEKVAEKSTTSLSESDVEQINTPYKPNVTPHYIKKPDAVVEYEEKKKMARAHKSNTEMPSFVEIKELFKNQTKRCNDMAHYITLADGTNLNRSPASLIVRATDEVAVKLSTLGLQTFACNESKWKFRYKIVNGEDFEKIKTALTQEEN